MGSPSIIGGALQGHLCARLLVNYSMQLEASCASAAKKCGIASCGFDLTASVRFIDKMVVQSFKVIKMNRD